MSDLNLKVKQIETLNFAPTELMIRIISTDIENATGVIYYELRQQITASPYHISCERLERGNVTLPMPAILAAFNNGQPNESVINQILQPFNLQYDGTSEGTEGASI